MTGARTSCIFCRAPDDLSGMKLANHCDLSDGEPCSACQDYMAIETQIALAKQVLNDLMIQRSKIRSRVNQNHDLLTCRLPVEIVCSVFQFCVPVDWDLDDFDFEYEWYSERKERRMVTRPLLLGRICKAWRTIAWGLESLWTVFRFLIHHNHSRDYTVLAREWLERTGQLPLSIRIADSCAPSNMIEAESEIASLINDRSEQWKNLDIIASPSFVSQIKGNSAGAPNLQALRILYNTDDHNKPEAPFSLIGPKPRPWHLSIHDSHVNMVHVDWQYLTNVFFSQPTPEEAIVLLQHASNVVSYRLYEFYEAGENFSIPDQPTIHVALESLEIGCSSTYSDQSEEITHFFQSFIFPNLEHLNIRSGGKLKYIKKEISWTPLVDHITNSSPSLISLVIQYLPFTNCVIPILKITPSLQNLEIVTPILDDMGYWGEEKDVANFFKLLTDTSLSNNTETDFLPNLLAIKLLMGRKHVNDQGGIWASIPGIFGPISDIHNPRRRPLTIFQVRLMRRVNLLGYIDISSKIAKLRKEGIILDLRDQYNKQVFQEPDLDGSLDLGSEFDPGIEGE